MSKTRSRIHPNLLSFQASIADLSTIHDELNDIAEEGSEFEDKLNQLRKRMEHIEVELKTKKARVENFLEWEALNKTLGLLKKKRALIVGSSFTHS